MTWQKIISDFFVVGRRGKDQGKRVFFPHFTDTASYKEKKKNYRKVGKT